MNGTDALKVYLEGRIAMWEMMGNPAVMERFLLRNGTFRPGAPFTGTRGKAKECFSNSTHLSIAKELTYEEGLFIRPDLPIAIHHAWCVDESGVVHDCTIDRPEECAYVGVTIESQELWRLITASGYYGVLDMGVGCNTKFMYGRDPDLEKIVTDIIAKERAYG